RQEARLLCHASRQPHPRSAHQASHTLPSPNRPRGCHAVHCCVVGSHSSQQSLYEILSEGEGAMDKRFKAHQTAGKAVREAVKALNLTVRSHRITSECIPCCLLTLCEAACVCD